VPYALVLTLGTSALLAPEHRFYAAAFAAQCSLYALAFYGAWLDSRSWKSPISQPAQAVDRLARIALTFLVLNASAVAGLWMFALGKKVWR
jgi:hypothetical protein